VSTRDDPDANPLLAAEIYLMNGDGSDQRRLTRNTDGDAFPKLSPDGARILFDSNRRRREGDPLNVFDLFVMDADGNNQTFLTHGSSGSWAPDGRRVVFHASASGKGKPLKTTPGAATEDNDLFVLSLPARAGDSAQRRNITNTPGLIEDDPDWSPDGRRIVFTSHGVSEPHQNATTAEIYVMAADGSGQRNVTNRPGLDIHPAWGTPPV
jgi:Tol biopolymer transport system component